MSPKKVKSSRRRACRGLADVTANIVNESKAGLQSKKAVWTSRSLTGGAQSNASHHLIPKTFVEPFFSNSTSSLEQSPLPHRPHRANGASKGGCVWAPADPRLLVGPTQPKPREPLARFVPLQSRIVQIGATRSQSALPRNTSPSPPFSYHLGPSQSTNRLSKSTETVTQKLVIL